MKKMKKVLALIVTAILCFATLAVTACGEKDATAYTLIVTDASGNVLEGVSVGICSYDEASGEKGNCLAPITTDADGKAVFETEEGVYVVNDDVLSGGYQSKEKYVLKAYGEYTIVLVNN